MFKCDLCQKSFSQHKNLRKHVKANHAGTPLPSLLKEPLLWYRCVECDNKFRSPQALRLHFKRVGHNIVTSKVESVNRPRRLNTENAKLTCPILCDYLSHNRKILRAHLETAHGIKVYSECFTFKSFKDFSAWLLRTQIETESKFVINRSKTVKPSETIHYFSCHRSGHFKSESKGLRRLKANGSIKINCSCPASIKVIERFPSGKCETLFFKTHVGHENFGQLFLSNNHKESLSTKKTKKPVDEIIQHISKEEGKILISHEDRNKRSLLFQSLISSVTSWEELNVIDEAISKIMSTFTGLRPRN